MRTSTPLTTRETDEHGAGITNNPAQGVDETKALACGSEQEARKIRVPEGTWEEVVTRGQQTGELAATIGVIRLYRTLRPGERIVNATQVNAVDGTDADDLTRAELEGRRQACQVLDFLHKDAPGYEAAHIAVMPASVRHAAFWAVRT